jgi:SAM-dependent methyltransferase
MSETTPQPAPQPVPERFLAHCPICDRTREFVCNDDFWWCRDGMSAPDCELYGCVTRERGIAEAILSVYGRDRLRKLAIHEAAPVMRGFALWMSRNCPGYVRTGYFPDQAFGATVSDNIGPIRNENLERQTFADGSFDLVVHLDVMEHLFDPFQALREIERTLKPDGMCIFTAPTDQERFHSEQVAFVENDALRIVGEPEYHGNPQRPEDGALVTWRYGYDLPLLIQRSTGFDVELRRYQSRGSAVMGYKNEVYLLRKRAPAQR